MNRWRGTAAATVGVAGLTLLAAGTAQAHVRVSAPKAVVGQPAMIDFRVPSEEQVATTVRFSITAPADVKITRTPAVPGWIVAMAKDTAGDTVVTWTSQGAGIAPAKSIDFIVGAGALPNRPTLSFDAVQTYSNGDAAYWNQQQDGSAEPPYPAPTLKLAGAAPGAAPDKVGLTPVPPGTAATKLAAPTVTAAPVAQHTGTPGWAVGLAIGGAGALGAAVTVAVMLPRRQSAGITR